MDDFSVIYRILKTLHAAMDCDEPDAGALSAERLRLEQSRKKKEIAPGIDN